MPSCCPWVAGRFPTLILRRQGSLRPLPPLLYPSPGLLRAQTRSSLRIFPGRALQMLSMGQQTALALTAPTLVLQVCVFFLLPVQRIWAPRARSLLPFRVYVPSHLRALSLSVFPVGCNTMASTSLMLIPSLPTPLISGRPRLLTWRTTIFSRFLFLSEQVVPTVPQALLSSARSACLALAALAVE